MKQTLLLLFYFQICIYFSQNECGAPIGHTGVIKEYYPGGAIEEVNTYLNGVKHGVCVSYYLDGTIKTKINYKLGKVSEVIQASDPVHNQKDYNTLHPKTNYTNNKNNSWQSESPSKWDSKKITINDTTVLEKWFFNKTLQREVTYINDDKRNVKQYYVENLPRPYPNENSDISFLRNQWHGQTIRYFLNGNLQFKGSYDMWKPIGTHYTYYNNKLQQVKTITHYNGNTISKNGFSNKIYSIKKQFDSAGTYTSYEITYAANTSDDDANGRAIKKVVFTNNSNEHTWQSNGYYSEHKATVYGVIENGIYKLKNVQNENGKFIVKNGNATFNNNYLPLTDVLFSITDTIKIPINKGTHTIWMIHIAEPIAPIIAQNYFIGGYESASYDLGMFTIPYSKWKGKINNGFLNGEWKMESENYITESIKTKTIFSGKFENSQREGAWRYENDFYFYTINYVNGKKEGELKPILKSFDYEKFKITNNIYYREIYEEHHKNKLPNLYNNILSLWVGSFKNNEMHGEWLAYYRYPDLLAFKAVFNNGNLIAKIEEYNLKQQLIAKRTIENNKIKTEIFYTPLGDEFQNKYITNNSYQDILFEKNNNIPHGKYLTWNNYTGQIFENGHYNNGLKNGNWTSISHGDTTISNFKNDTLHGFYKHYNSIYNNEQHICISGYYAMGKKTGLWKYDYATEDSLYKEELINDNQTYLLTYIFGNKKYIEKGIGCIITTENGLQTKSEEYYKNGKMYKTILIYKQNNQIASINYKTLNGDSLAYYMPPESGTCVKNGTGMKTYYDGKKRIYKIEYYNKGKLIKHDIYYDGQYGSTEYFRFSSDTTGANKSSILFEKEITKSHPLDETRDGNFLYVTLRIYNPPKNSTYFKISDGYPSDKAVILEAKDFNSGVTEIGKITFIRVKPITSNVIEIVYKYPYYSRTSNYYNTEVRYMVDKKHFSLSPLYPILN